MLLTGLTGLYGLFFFAAFPEENGETQSRTMDGKKLKILSIKNSISFIAHHFNGSYY